MSGGGGRMGDDMTVEAIEIDLLMEAMFRRYGHDFRQYARASRRRSVITAVEDEQAGTVSGLQARVLREPAAAARLVDRLTVHASSLFGDPAFYRAFRAAVVPELKALPRVRLWYPECADGAAVYSMAILLAEEGLLDDRCRIYATDLSEAALDTARRGVYPAARMEEFEAQYAAAGGGRSLSRYCTADGEVIRLRPSLRDRLVFATHNLASGASLNEFHVIVCRNVLTYFQKPLQERVHLLLFNSLAPRGFLALGHDESIAFAPYQAAYRMVDAEEQIYQRVK